MMLRRPGRGAYISPPHQLSPADSLSSAVDSGDEKAPSRLSRRSFGVTNRIWLLLLLFLALLFLTHLVLPSHNSASGMRDSYSNALLKSKDYFNMTEGAKNPFEFCPSYGPGDTIAQKYGASVLSKSRMHLGSGRRIQRVLNRALAGKPVTISVIGASVSACHGAGDDPISPLCYPSKFFRWWNSVFPHPATELTNGAMRRTNSAYYGYCSAHHIPDVTDLVIVELDAADTPDQASTDNFELLIRSILLRPDLPAVLLLGHFSPQVHQTYGFAGPDHWHDVVAQFYDLPHISTKNALFPEYMRDPKSVEKYYADPVLASPKGHDVLSDMLIAYFQDQACTAWAVATGTSFDTAAAPPAAAAPAGLFGGVGLRKGVPGQEDGDSDVDAQGNRRPPAPQANADVSDLGVPLGRINTRPTPGATYEEIAPFCVSANDLINPLPASLFYGSGWYVHHPLSSSSGGAGGGNTLSSAAHYFYSTLPTSKLRVPILVGAGDIAVYYLREPLSEIGEGSQVECWVDDNYAGAKMLENAAEVGEATPTLEVIDRFVTRGSHFVECQLLGEEGQAVPVFKILGIFAT